MGSKAEPVPQRFDVASARQLAGRWAGIDPAGTGGVIQPRVYYSLSSQTDPSAPQLGSMPANKSSPGPWTRTAPTVAFVVSSMRIAEPVARFE